MRMLLDEDSQSKMLIGLLRDAGHDVTTAAEAGLAAHSDREVFAFASSERRVLLTRNGSDFIALAAGEPDHPGLLIEHQDREPSKNMPVAEIVNAIANIEASGWTLTGKIVAINAWRFHAPGV